MIVQEDDQDETGIPLLGREEASSFVNTVPARRAHQTSPLRFALAISLLLALGFASFYAWSHGRPLYKLYSVARNPHHKQIHAPNGSVITGELDLVRPLFGAEADGGVDTFDLVASVYFIQYPHELDGRPETDGGSEKGNSTTMAATGHADNDGATTTDDGSSATDGFSADQAVAADKETIDKKEAEPDWERVMSEPVMRGLHVNSFESTVVNVILPGRIASVSSAHLVAQWT